MKTHLDKEQLLPHGPDFVFEILPQRLVHKGAHNHALAEIFQRG